MHRPLNTATLNGAIRDYTGQWFLPSRPSRANPDRWIGGRNWVIQNLYDFHFKDEFDYILAGIRRQLGQDALVEFDKAAADKFTPRDDTVFEQLLAEKLAIRPDGSRIEGKLGTVQIGERVIGYETALIPLRSGRTARILRTLKEPVFAGDPDYVGSVGAASLTMSAAVAVKMLDVLVDEFDIGSTAATISGYSGTRPADPDAAITGTLLFANTMTDPAFAGAVDDADGTVSATAAAIADDTSADATGTATHFRCRATGTGADDVVDGNIGTSGEDMNLNTVSIVSGANVSITSYVMNLSQGSGAT